MNHVERFRAVMNFQEVDRLPRWEWATWWNLTIERWKGEGLPAHLQTTFDIHAYFGLDPFIQFWFRTARPDLTPEQKAMIGHVASMDDYMRLRPALFPDHSADIDKLRPWVERQAQGEAVLWITLEGYFWFPRTLMGFGNVFYAYYDQPELMHRINQDLLDFNLRQLEQLRRIGCPTFMTVAEDMSYNHGPMVSRPICDEFMTPYYLPMLERAKEMGMLVIVDTDGDVTMLVPWLQSVGVDGALPLERQAGVDGMLLRERFPTWRMIGHYDKMVMPHGEEAMRAEFERLLPLIKSGGYIPSVDHQTPPGVSLEEYRVYLRLLREYT